MTFLTPLFLFGLLAAAIPLAIHLIRREHPPKVAFSSLRFMKQTTRKLVLFQQIQQWLLLLLRAALIILLALAFARPLIHSTPLARLLDAEPESLVLLLDTSLSMQHGERFSRLQQEARAQINALATGDEVAVITFSAAARQGAELAADPAAALAAIASLEQPGYDVARFSPALQLAEESLQTARHERQRVVMISGFPANAIQGLDSTWLLPPGVLFEGIDVGGEGVRNLSLSDVRAPAQLLEGVSDHEILARVRSSGTINVDSAALSLWIDGEMVEQQQVSLDRSAEAVVTLPVSFESDGQYLGEIRVSGDDFAADNSHFFSIEVLPRVRVLVINGAPSRNWFEDAAHWFTLALSGDGSAPYLPQVIEAPALDETRLAGQDVVVVLNTANFDDAQTQALQGFADRGGHLLLAPGSAVDAAQFNRVFATLAPASLQNSRQLAGNDYLLIADVDRRHPLLAPLEIDWSTRFQGYWQLAVPVDDEQVLMRFDNAAPAMLEGQAGAGRVLMLTTSLDLGWSNLPLQAAYLPLIHEALNYLVQAPAQQSSWRVGDLLAVDLPQASLQTPDGQNVALDAGQRAWPAQTPGFYRLSAPDEVRVLAVNTPVAASDLERMAVSALHDRIINPDTTPQRSAAVRTATLIADIEQPQRLWWWIVLLVMFLLLAETAVANRTYR